VVRPAALRYQQAPAATRPAPVPKPEDAQKAVALLDRAIAAKGGLTTLRGLRTIIAKQTLSSPSDPRAPHFEATTYIQYPDRLRIETRTPEGLNIQGYDGKEAWVKNEQGVHAQSSIVASQARLGMRRDTLSLLLAAKDGVLSVRLLPDVSNNVPGGAPRIDHVLELTAPDLNPILIYIDPESSLVTKQTFVDEAPGRPLVEERFSDYRLVNGIQIAFKATRRIGMQLVDRLVSDVKINADIDPALFLRPAS
jgi:outer membrane lipoprotein-sorting protein